MKFYFAWCQEEEQFDLNVHARQDETLFSLEISGEEAKYPLATVQIINPKCGLLYKDRAQWAYISGDRGQGIEIMFRGRVVAIPEKIEGETLKILLLAEPTESQKLLMTLHQNLRVAPFWDPLFVRTEEHNNPFESLEARTSLYCWSRTEERVILSDYFEGRKLLSLKGNFYRDRLRISRTATPLTGIDVTLTAEWIQHYEGRTDVSRALQSKFSEGMINTLTGKNLEQGWWKSGEKIRRSGYWIAYSKLQEISPKYTGALNLYPAYSKPFWVSPHDPLNVTKKPQLKRLKRSWYRAKLVFGWSYRQRRQENLHFKLTQKTQTLAYDPPYTRKLHLHLQNLNCEEKLHPWKPDWIYSRGYRVVEEGMIYQCLRAHHSKSIFQDDKENWQLLKEKTEASFDSRRGSFFLTDRGKVAFEHALEIARAHLAATARAITLKIEAPLEALWDVTCDHTLEIEDYRLPGGKVRGKVIHYSLKVEEASGRRWAEVTLGVSIGEPVSQDYLPLSSFETYVDSRYIASEAYQGESATWQKSPSGTIYQGWGNQYPHRGYLYPETLRAEDIVEDIILTNKAEDQNKVLQETQYPYRHNLRSILRNTQTDIRFILADLQTLGTLTHDVHVTIPMTWSAPQQIDLAAAPLKKSSDEILLSP